MLKNLWKDERLPYGISAESRTTSLSLMCFPVPRPFHLDCLKSPEILLVTATKDKAGNEGLPGEGWSVGGGGWRRV